MTPGSGADEAGFERKAADLANALDEFSELLEAALAGYPPGKDALARNIGVDKSFISSWLRGHRQLLDAKGRRLVSEQDVAKMIEVTRLRERDEALTRNMEATAAGITALVKQLSAVRPNRWRSEAARALLARAEVPERAPADTPPAAEAARPVTPAVPMRAPASRAPAPAPAEPAGPAEERLLDQIEPAGAASRFMGGLRRWLYVAAVAVVALVAYLQFAGGGGGDAGGLARDGVTVLPSRLCRSWAPMAQQVVEVRPCIAKSGGRMELSTEARAIDPENAPDEITIWVWLMNLDRRLIDTRQYHLTRDEATLQLCTLSIKKDEVVRCGPFRHEPPGPGQYATAVSASLQHDLRPPGWDSPAFTGTQSPPLVWP